jgi:hypothetical protein
MATQDAITTAATRVYDIAPIVLQSGAIERDTCVAWCRVVECCGGVHCSLARLAIGDPRRDDVLEQRLDAAELGAELGGVAIPACAVVGRAEPMWVNVGAARRGEHREALAERSGPLARAAHRRGLAQHANSSDAQVFTVRHSVGIVFDSTPPTTFSSRVEDRTWIASLWRTSRR